jgi:hypothetical protein|tara:strand:- start:1320 stop:1721 length:402 start_codon:yes stop_codon:yes gene_type:complete
VLSFFLLSSGSGYSNDEEPRNTANLYIISPADGTTQKNPVKIVFGLSGMGVAPAGVDIANTGHHHLLIDLDTLPDKSLPIPSDDKHRHFGAGQTETTIDLSKGSHTLQLILGNHSHVPHETPVVSKKITINIE